MDIHGAKFQEHCFNISRDIVYSVFITFQLQYSMADVIPFQRIYYSLRIKSVHNTRRNYILYTIKKAMFLTPYVYACFKSFWRINISGYVIYGYLWYGRVEI